MLVGQSNELSSKRLADLGLEYSNLYNEKIQIEDEIWRECKDPGISLPKNPVDIIKRFLIHMDNAFKKSTNSNWALIELEYLEDQERLVYYLLDYEGKISVFDKELSALEWNYVIPNRISNIRKAIRNKHFEIAEKLLLEMSHEMRKKGIIPDDIVKLLNDLKIKQLMIVPDGILHALPFELVREENETLNESWGIKYSLTRGFSMGHFSSQLGLNEDKILGNALIIGNPTDMLVPERLFGVNDSDYYWNASLPGAEEEAKQIDDILSNNYKLKTVLLLREKATKNAFIQEANDKEYLFIHFAGHARFEDTMPDQSYLLLYKDLDEPDFLYANEISLKLRLKGAPIVVLSSCESATSQIQMGNEAFGLIRSFILGGASNLVLTAWPVLDESAKDLMQLLYTRLSEGSGISMALSYSRLEVLKRAQKGNYKRKELLLHWAAFQVWGSPVRKYVRNNSSDIANSTVLSTKELGGHENDH